MVIYTVGWGGQLTRAGCSRVMVIAYFKYIVDYFTLAGDNDPLYTGLVSREGHA